MNLQDIIARLGPVANAVDQATPDHVKPVGQVHTSTPFKWSVAALIGALVAVFALTCYVVWTIFGPSQWPHVESVVLSQLSNQRAVAIGLLVLLGIQILAVVYAATSATFSASIGVAGFTMGAAGRPADTPTQVATVTVSAPATSQVDVATPAGAMVPDVEPEPEMPMEATKGMAPPPPPPYDYEPAPVPAKDYGD